MARTIKLNSGYDMPTIGLGTWQAPPGEVEAAVKLAIDEGYRLLDCAMVYGNEREIGDAVAAKFADGTVKREDMFITSKLWNTFHRPELVEDACKRTLDALQMDYLDLYLMHWPIAFKEGEDMWPRDSSGRLQTVYMDFTATWHAMEELQRSGLVRSIGVSNFNTQQLQRLMDAAEIRPAVNQVECHPYLTQRQLRAACRARGVVVTAYSPLGAPNAKLPYMTTQPGAGAPAVLQDHRLRQLAEKYGKTVAQVVLKYLVQSGMVAIPKSTNPERLRENINIYDFKLASSELLYIDSFNCGVRAYPLIEAKDDVNYPFHIE